jgi:hypothetical protein
VLENVLTKRGLRVCPGDAVNADTFAAALSLVENAFISALFLAAITTVWSGRVMRTGGERRRRHKDRSAIARDNPGYLKQHATIPIVRVLMHMLKR